MKIFELNIPAHLEEKINKLQKYQLFFYGVFNHYFKLDDMILEALEDPLDGYRSYLDTIHHYNGCEELNYLFFDKPLGKVMINTITSYKDEYGLNPVFNGWELQDVDNGHIWLKIGTNSTDEHHPYFVFDYTPCKNQTKFPKIKSSYVPFKERHPEIILQHIEWFNGDH